MIMLDKKPRYTAQLELAGSILKTTQIKDISNRNLSPDEKTQVETALQQALELRAKELTPEPTS